MKIQYGSCVSEYAPENRTVIIPGIGGRESREISFKVIASIIEARMAEIVEAVQYEIDRSGYLDKLNGGIVVTGGGAQLANLCQFVKYKTGYDTRIASPNINITFDSCEGVNKPSSSTAVGLILYGYECEKFIQEESRKNENSAVGGTLFDPEELEKVEVSSTSSPIEKRVKREKPGGKTIFKGLRDQMNEFFSQGDNEA